MTETAIRVLSEEVINKIAAGEVVERPASVVKELIENSLDAKARRIEIEIKDGGQKLIEVTDDGFGMSPQDAVLAFTRHATSKITTDEDLASLLTLGFRGEALASIAAVSRVTLTTRKEEAELGTRVQVDGGTVRSIEPVGNPRGTIVQVKNIFFNVPARRKFLKSQQGEMAQISDVVGHFMLGYPEISFRFTRGNSPVAVTTGSGNLIDAIVAVYGPDTARNLLPLKCPSGLSNSGISVSGFISPPNAARKVSRFMSTLLNRRFVKSKLIGQAISKALSSFFPKGGYPVLILDLRIPGDMIDVNVHPQKTEVRFKDEHWIFGILYEIIQTSLSGLRLLP
ncbi:DNA mismatch repair endonuclease MutL, partial [bacterium]|nr:DNA mismatch repair endonuclease MutL [bacterium]